MEKQELARDRAVHLEIFGKGSACLRVSVCRVHVISVTLPEEALQDSERESNPENAT